MQTSSMSEAGVNLNSNTVKRGSREKNVEKMEAEERKKSLNYSNAN